MPDPNPDTAIDKLSAKLKLVMIGANGVNAFVDRSIDDPLQEGELPGQVIRIVDVEYNILDQQQQFCQGKVQIDFLSDKSTLNTIGKTNNQCAARFIAAIAADRSLGGMVQTIEEQSLSSDADKGVDVGCAVLTMDMSWSQPRGDFFTIVGVTGERF